MSSGEHLDVTAPVSLGQALLLHDLGERRSVPPREVRDELRVVPDHDLVARMAELLRDPPDLLAGLERRSEEHTSELQSQSNLVCRLLLEKKKKISVNMVPCES